ncbi:putative chloride channel protein [Smittium mucronatum]|uniref:Putative chloride channel protein n=1 Tax=Smittium mucronatum TaxID=133383 RepID=A0A1R0H4M8_9FUNG|nr:putative chloride channel protein [Smittium mucronatum]
MHKHSYEELTARFDEFETIDWIAESNKESIKRNELNNSNVDTLNSFIHSLYETIQVWVSILAFICAYLVQYFAPFAAGSGLPELKTVLGGFHMDKFLDSWTLLIKSSGLALAVASGLSVGKEGPAVHMGCCVGNVVSQHFGKYKNSKIKNREILSASAAAGIAVAFGSPIGGVLFSMEDISYVFPLQTLSRSFFCALIATTVIHVMNPFRTGKLVMFQATYTRQWQFFEIIFFIIIGVFGGLVGAALTNFNMKVARFRKRYLKALPIQEVVFIALCSSTAFYFNIFTRIDMGKLLSYLFQECEDGNWAGLCQPENNTSIILLLLLATVVRFIGTGFAYGCKVPCGIFVPSMAIGATFGRMLGILVQSAQRMYPGSFFFSQCSPDVPCITPATYAFLGAAAGLGGVTRVTVSVVVIMYELTGAVAFIVPTIIVVMISKLIADYISPGAISEQLIELNGMPFIERNSYPLGKLISSVMKSKLTVLPANGISRREINRILDSCPYKVFPIVNNLAEMKLEGVSSRDKLIQSLNEVKPLEINGSSQDMNSLFNTSKNHNTEDLRNDYNHINPDLVSFVKQKPGLSSSMYDFSKAVDLTPIVVDVNSSTETVSEIFESLGPKVVLVQNNMGRLVGLICRKDMIKAKILKHCH